MGLAIRLEQYLMNASLLALGMAVIVLRLRLSGCKQRASNLMHCYTEDKRQDFD